MGDKICSECVHFNASAYKCAAPKNTGRHPVTGEAHDYCGVSYLRQAGWLTARLENLCGKEGRWHKEIPHDPR